MSKKVAANLRLGLDIHIDTPKGNPYRGLKNSEMHVAKMELLSCLSHPTLRTFMKYWEGMTVDVDDDMIDTIPPGKTIIESHLAVANPALKSAISFEIGVEELCPGQPCTKLPNCSHNCEHVFGLSQLERDAKGKVISRKPWVITGPKSKVVADVVAILQWTSESSAHADHAAGSP